MQKIVIITFGNLSAFFLTLPSPSTSPPVLTGFRNPEQSEDEQRTAAAPARTTANTREQEAVTSWCPRLHQTEEFRENSLTHTLFPTPAVGERSAHRRHQPRTPTHTCTGMPDPTHCLSDPVQATAENMGNGVISLPKLNYGALANFYW